MTSSIYIIYIVHCYCELFAKTHVYSMPQCVLFAPACALSLQRASYADVAGQNEIQVKMKFLCLLTLIIHGS